MGEKHGDQRGRPARRSGIDARCPWCGGDLVLHTGYPFRQLFPGELRVSGEEVVPEYLRLTTAWVCTTPHCRYRDVA